jgi:RNA polymerase sigma-70 factor, ECF subfamily
VTLAPGKGEGPRAPASGAAPDLDPADAEDNGWIREFQAGREQGFNRLVLKHQDRVYGLCLRLLAGQAAEAEDAAQEAFVRAYRGLDAFEGRSHLMTWITRIAINQCLSHLATRGREKLGMLNFLHERENEDQGGGWEEETSRLAVGRLLESADPVTRKVLVLAMHQGLTHSQIATTLGVSRVAITRRITRFKRNALRRALRPA